MATQFTIENITKWLNTRELPDTISLRCVLDECRYLLIVNERLKIELAAQIPGEMNLDIEMREAIIDPTKIKRVKITGY